MDLTASGRSDPRVLVLGHHDADGVVSAAVAGAYLAHVAPDARLTYGMVDFHLSEAWARFWHSLQSGEIPGWDEPGTPDGVAIVDFPAATVPDSVGLLYADHHETSFRSCGADAATEALYVIRARHGDVVLHDPTSPSCVTLLIDALTGRNGWNPPETLRSAASMADRIDRASFGSAAEAVDHRRHEPAAVSAACLALPPEDLAATAAALARGVPLEDALFTLHADSIAVIFDDLDRSMAGARKAIRVLSDSAVLIDWTHEAVRNRRPVRFAEYHHTDARYSARMEARPIDDGRWAIQVTLGRSPWASSPADGHVHPHLGSIAESVGGGGHPYAAGFRVEGDDLDSTRRRSIAVITGIAALLRPLEEDHPMADRTVR